MIRKRNSLVVVFIAFSLILSAQKAEIRDTVMTLKTYPFSDPNPIPKISTIYPYFTYDGYSVNGAPQNWKIVEMENDYIKLFITPAIGGKVWGAIDKKSGKEFIHFNHVVRFINVGVRGPWTAGGIEYNFGIIGHDPANPTPVDYYTRNKNDGSVSCYVSSTDYPSGTRRLIEINLPNDKSYFTTHVILDNPTMLETSYYHWMNASAKTAGNLEYVFPGRSYLGHGGESYRWPVQEEGHEISFYEKNDFGEMKSYHVIGEIHNFFGGYWHDDDFGFAHYASYDEKPGTKIWIWGLSPKGMIWEHLATDTDGQYTEIQSGRSFNQAGFGLDSPFKYQGFTPGLTDEWTEYWFPVKGTNGLKYSIPEGSVNLVQKGDTVSLWFCPNIKTEGNLEVKSGAKTVFAKGIKTTPLVTVNESFGYKNDYNKLSVWFDNKLIFDANRDNYVYDRPVYRAHGFNWETAYGQFTLGIQSEYQRNYQKAEESYRKCLDLEPWFAPALTGMANVLYRRMDYKTANEYALKSLSVNTYDPEANMAYARTELALGDTASAIDGFSVASLSSVCRPAAFNGLSVIYLNKKDYVSALSYADKSLNYNQKGTEATQLKILSLRLLNQEKEYEKELNKLDAIDPLNHFIRFEKYLAKPSTDNEEVVKKYIFTELKHETYLTYALWYYDVGRISDAIKVISLSEDQPVVDLWKAYFQHLVNNDQIAKEQLNKAISESPYLVFPYRCETVKPLEWALKQSTSWKLKYYLGLIYLNLGDIKQCEDLWKACGDEPDFYPFYIARAGLYESLDDQITVGSIFETKVTSNVITGENTNQLASKDIERALLLGSNEWRAGMTASEFYMKKGEIEKALNICKTNFSIHPKNYYVGTQLAVLLTKNQKYTEAIELLKNLKILKGEATGPARSTWVDANILLALEKIQKKDYKTALKHIDMSKEYLFNLVQAKPYVTDERVEDFIASYCLEKLGRKKEAASAKERISAFVRVDGFIPNSANDFLSIWILRTNNETKLASEILGQLVKNNNSDMIKWCVAVYKSELTSLTNELKDTGKMDSKKIIFLKMHEIGFFGK